MGRESQAASAFAAALARAGPGTFPEIRLAALERLR